MTRAWLDSFLPTCLLKLLLGKSLRGAMKTLKLDKLCSCASIRAHRMRYLCAHACIISSYYWSFDAVEAVVTPTTDTQRPVEDEDCCNLVIKCCRQKLAFTGTDEREDASFSTFLIKKKVSWLSGLVKIEKPCGLPSIWLLWYHLHEPDFLWLCCASGNGADAGPQRLPTLLMANWLNAPQTCSSAQWRPRWAETAVPSKAAASFSSKPQLTGTERQYKTSETYFAKHENFSKTHNVT